MNPHIKFPRNFKPVKVAKCIPTRFQLEENSQPGEVSVAQEQKVAKLFIWGDIGGWWGVNGSDVYNALAGRDVDEIEVYLSSAGGGILQGFEIYDILKGHKANVTVYIFSLAASSATVIASAGDKVVMSRQSLYMIHEGAAWLCGWYSADEMAHESNTLKMFNGRIIDVYSRFTGQEPGIVQDLMKVETWYGPDEALEAGFVTDVVDHISVPFEDAEMTSTSFDDWFFHHTSKAAKSVALQHGFVPMAANVLERILASTGKDTPANSTHKVSNPMNPLFAKFLNLLSGQGFKIQNEAGEVVDSKAVSEKLESDETAAKILNDALGDEGRKQINDLVATAIAKAVSDSEKTTAGVIAALKDQVVALSNQLKENPPAQQQTIQAQASDMEKLKNDIIALKLGKSGGQRLGDNSDTSLNDGATDDKAANMAFGQKSYFFKSLESQGLVNAAQIAEMDRLVNLKRTELGKTV